MLNKSVDAVYEDAWVTVHDCNHCLGKMMPHKSNRALQLAKHSHMPYRTSVLEGHTTSPSTERDNEPQRLSEVAVLMAGETSLPGSPYDW